MTTEVYHSKQPQEDLVPIPQAHLLPIPDNTVKTLFYWAMDLDITQGARMVLLTVIRHVAWADGTGCTASIPTLAREAHQTKKTTVGHIKTLIDAGLISRKRRFSKATETLLPTSTVSVETTPTVSVETTLSSQRSGNASNQSSSSTNPINQCNPPKMSKKKQPETEKNQEEETKTTKKQRDTVKTFQTLEEEGATGVTNSPPRKTLEEVEEWVEATMQASPTFLFADGVLKRYEKQWWRPFTGSNPKSGFAATTPRSTAVKKYMGSREDWTRLRADLTAKAFQDGGPFPVFDQHDGGNPKLKEPVLCFTCKEMTMAYGEKNTVFKRLEGPAEIDKCDVCLSRQPVAV